jgi:hypothetical protein
MFCRRCGNRSCVNFRRLLGGRRNHALRDTPKRQEMAPRAGSGWQGKSSERLPKEPLRCCPGEGIRRNGRFCHASRASITSAAPTTLTQPTHDLAAGAADPARERSALYSLVEKALESKGFRHNICEKPLIVRTWACVRTVTAVLQWQAAATFAVTPRRS